ncbi:methyltransferase CmcJ [Xylaria acuta]|nr:methyltransferase CmcJ [Xylaria acuta]
MNSYLNGREAYSTTGEVRYLDRLELYKSEKPYEVTFAPVNVKQPGARRTNFSLSYWDVALRDLTSNRASFTTDVQGFELDKFPTSLSALQLQDPDIVESLYHPEAINYLEHKYSAKKVLIFDTTIREARRPRQHSSKLLRNQQTLGVATDCHINLLEVFAVGSCIAYPTKLKNFLSSEFGIWRPLVWPYHTMPLAMCDWRSTAPEDFTASDHKTPIWEGESLQVYYNPVHQWWFARTFAEDDVLLLKMYDSDAERDGSKTAMCTPHCSFDWKDAPHNTQARQSMEIRALIFS